MRSLYSFLLYLATPLVLAYFFLRGLRDAGYRGRLGERFGFFAPPRTPGGIVVHAASLGEVNAASELLRRLKDQPKMTPLTVTTVTPAGSARVQELFGGELQHVYAPLDLPGAVGRFFGRMQPHLLIVMETEIWPNLYAAAHRRGIPILVVNARVSPRSLGRYLRLRRWTARVLGQVAAFGAQSAADAERLRAIGAAPERITVTGNLKFDQRLEPGLEQRGAALRASWGTDRPVLAAGSTHEGDERALLQAFGGLLRDFPQALLLLAPRRPERFARAAQLAREAGFAVAMRSQGLAPDPAVQCLIVDSMGELQTFYAACDVAFVGGSLEPHGGHNVLEAAALGRPIVVGPHTFNFEEITRCLVEDGAALRVADAEQLEAALRKLLGDPGLRGRMAAAARKRVESGQGALARTLELVERTVTAAAG